MIAHLSGRVLRKSPQEVVLDVGGVGYRVSIPLTTFYRLGAEGEAAALRVHTHVREETIALFGFLTVSEHELFEKLIAVAGVGPKLAVNILSGIETDELMAALRGGDLARLTRIPGVGRKTAERLVLELKDKMPPAPSPSAEPVAGDGAADTEDVLSALVHLGYSRGEAERAVERAAREGGPRRFEDLLRQALRALSR
ncbi:MAG TPA: Holliday junction branch migration protein RuvA [Vicinamibacteria bacterium]|nr:Holliday junction branch migration protein RuvA [Vicinamibacteria bacterium]